VRGKGRPVRKADNLTAISVDCLEKVRVSTSHYKPPRSVTEIIFNFPLYLISVSMHSANAVKSCTKACRRVLTSTVLHLIGSEYSCDLGSVTYKLNLKNNIYNYSIYILNLVGRSIGKFLSQSP
jgi:hypothetical protein